MIRVGEGGQDEAIIPLDGNGGIATGGGGRSVTLNVNLTIEGSVISEGDLGDVILERVAAGAATGALAL